MGAGFCFFLRKPAAIALLVLCLSLPAITGGGTPYPSPPKISDELAWTVGRRIWRNESGGSYRGLACWNRGEEFASMGIAHFIWYPRGYRGPFQETFPNLIEYLDGNGARLPEWLALSPECPWSNRREFLDALRSRRMKQLRGLLARTTHLQARFVAERMRHSLPRLLWSAREGRVQHVRRQFERVWRTPGGIYALIDYVNFKGEGVHLAERYRGRGWGLLQVLEEMREAPAEVDPLKEFRRAARLVLIRRVRNSPPSRNERRWLKGWLVRVDRVTRG